MENTKKKRPTLIIKIKSQKFMKKDLQQGHRRNYMRTFIWTTRTKINMSPYLKILTNSFCLGTINTKNYHRGKQRSK